MPWAAPASLTRSMNAGGNEYSRPHSNPTFTQPPSLDRGASSRRPPLLVCHRILVSGARFRDQPPDHRAEVSGFLIDLHLSIGAGAVLEDLVHVVERLAASQFVHHVV